MRHLLLCFFLVSVYSQPSSAFFWGSSNKAKSESRFNYDKTIETKEVNEFWKKRKMGVGIVGAGAYGLLGFQVAFQWHPQWGVSLGYGGGSHFQSFGFSFKKLLLVSSPLNPYFGLGFHRWQRVTTRPFNPGSVSPGMVAGEFMSEADKATGNIDESLLSPTFGLQYTFTNGPWKGVGVFVEGIWLISAVDFQSAPTASTGMTYFF